MKKVFAVLAISTLVAFTSCKKAEEGATTATDSSATKTVETTTTEVKDSVKTDSNTVVAPADSVKK